MMLFSVPRKRVNTEDLRRILHKCILDEIEMIL